MSVVWRKSPVKGETVIFGMFLMTSNFLRPGSELIYGHKWLLIKNREEGTEVA